MELDTPREDSPQAAAHEVSFASSPELWRMPKEMESVAQRWEALYRKSADRIKEMEDRIRSLEQEVQDWKRVAELWKSMCVSILPPPRAP